jgi:hypothetical protein
MSDQFLHTLAEWFFAKPYGLMIVVLVLCMGGFAIWDRWKKHRH